MPYLMLIVERDRRETFSPEERRSRFDRMMRFSEDLQRRGVLQGSNSLKSDAEGVRVEIRGGKKMVIEGPFAESKEFVGGYFLLDCRTRDEAAAIAAECPAAAWATVEVREVGACYE